MKISKPVVVILGASLDQAYMLRTARSMGFHVLAMDMNPKAACRDLADDFAPISTKDIAAITAHLDALIADGVRIAGVTTMGSDIPDVVAAVSAHLGTPSISPTSAAIATDKVRMKACFAEHGIPIPWYREIGSLDELRDIIAERGPDLVIKPNDRSGSRGVFLLNASCDFADLFAKSLEFSFSKRILVEEFLPGPQISTETVMVGGVGHTPGFADRNYDGMERFHPQIMENGGWVPSVLGDEDRRAIEDLVVRSSLAMGVTDGITKGDVVLTPDGPKMIEMAARLSGGDFCAALVPLGSGVNYVRTAIELATGRAPDLSALHPKWNQAVANRYFFPPPGRLVRIDGVDEVRSWDWVDKLEFWYGVGDVIPPALSHAHRFGVFVATAPDRAQLEERVARVYETISIVIDQD
ncbi:MAG: ATP-grasp domain-containing protein [Alphaproteobacteria bacterium]|nr:ATP-grasp domain-containing protein [Alphaproteobacteria bacterium]